MSIEIMCRYNRKPIDFLLYVRLQNLKCFIRHHCRKYFSCLIENLIYTKSYFVYILLDCRNNKRKSNIV